MIKEFISAEAIQEKIEDLAERILKNCDQPLHCIVVLKGAATFYNALKHVWEVEGVQQDMQEVEVQSYKGMESSGTFTLKKDIVDVKGKDLVIIEDILDSGFTMTHLLAHLRTKGAKSIKVVVLMNKQARRKYPVTADFIGFDVPDAFVVGFGLDYEEKYRDLPFIGIIEEKS